MAKVTFDKKSLFHVMLKKNVDEYFCRNNLKKTGNWNLYIKSIVLILSEIIIYMILLFIHLDLLSFILLCSLLGFILAGIGFNIMHDACHRSYSSKKWVNNILELTLNALGGNAYIYKQKHNIHHSYTNIDGIDDDIAKSPIIRQCNSQKWLPVHRFQHLYIVIVYAISGLAWITILDYSKYFTGMIFKTEMRKMSIYQHVLFWLSKLLYVLFYLIIPLHLIGRNEWAIGFMCLNVAMGLTLALIFQMAHVVELTKFEAVGDELKLIESEWAIHQLKSTANFAPKNRFIIWFSGGLNYQIEHHLFPGICHIHYPVISKIVKGTCKEFGLPYHSYPTFSQALSSHFRLMKKLGEKPIYTFYK